MIGTRIIRYIQNGEPNVIFCANEKDFTASLASILLADNVTEYGVYGVVEAKTKIARWEDSKPCDS